jgi:hypothetical protein
MTKYFIVFEEPLNQYKIKNAIIDTYPIIWGLDKYITLLSWQEIPKEFEGPIEEAEEKERLAEQERRKRKEEETKKAEKLKQKIVFRGTKILDGVL